MAERSLTERIVRGAKASMSAQLIDNVANGLLIVVLTRYVMSPEGFGLLQYAISIIGTVAILGTLGLPSAAARYVTEYAEQDPSQVAHVIRFSIGAILAFSLIVGGVLALFSGTISGLLGEPALTPLLIVGFGYVVCNAMFNFTSRLFQAINRVEWSAVVRSISGVTRLVAATGLAAIGFGAVGALAGYVVGFVLAIAVGVVVFFRRFADDYSATGSFDEDLRRRILEYSVPLTATRGANVLDKRVDIILVGFFLGPVPVSFYTIGKQVSQFAGLPATSLGYTISPAVGEQKAAEQLERARRVYEESLRHVLMLYIPATVGLVLVAEPTIRHIFGSDYAGAAPVLQVLSGFMLANAVNKVTSDGLDYIGRARERAIVKTVTAAANFLLNLILIPTIGVVGAAIATVATYIVYTSANVYIMHQELDLNLGPFVRVVPTVSGISLIMAVVVWTLLPYVSGLVTLLCVVVIGACVWGVLVTGSGLIDVRDVQSLL